MPPIVDFDALFIAESYENVVLIAPQLAFHEVFGPRLLGPDGWYHEDLVRVVRQSKDVICLAFLSRTGGRKVDGKNARRGEDVNGL